MGNAFDEFIELRCDEALLANKEFRKLQIESDEAYKRNDLEKYYELSMQMLVIAESTSYKQAFRDYNSLLSQF